MFDRLVTGHANAMAEVLRGRIGVKGELEPLILLATHLSRPTAPKGETMSDEIKILDGNTFVVSDSSRGHRGLGDRPDRPVLVRHALSLALGADVNGERLTALSTDDLQYFETRFFLIPGASAVYQNSKQSVIRTRAVADGFHEQITVLNHDEKPFDLTLRLEAASDFADLFEVKDALEKKGKYSAKVDPGRLVLGYQRETYSQGNRDHGDRAGQVRPEGPDLQGPGSAAGPVVYRHRGDDLAARRIGAPCRGAPSETSRPASTAGSAMPRASNVTGSRSGTRTAAASSTSPRCASRP